MKKEDCMDFFLLADRSRLCKHQEGHTHCLCENMVRFGECPKVIINSAKHIGAMPCWSEVR